MPMPKLMINGRKYSPALILFDVDGTLVDDSHRYSERQFYAPPL